MIPAFQLGLIASAVRVAVAAGTGADPHAASVVLAIRAEGINGSSTFTDSSIKARVPSSVTSATISATGGKFGGSIVSGPTSHILYASSVDFSVPAEMTIEFWINPRAGRTTNAYFMARSPARCFILGTDGSLSAVSPIGSQSFDTTVASGVWTHIAVSRNAAGQTRLFKDGVQVQMYSSTTTDATAQPFDLLGVPGRSDLPSLDGQLDDVRITYGVCRYTSNFTPVQIPFTVDASFSNVSILLHGDGEDGSAIVTNAKPGGIAPTVNGVTLATATKKFGASSLRFQGSNRLSFANHSSIDLSTGDFTIEAWINTSNVVSANSVGTIFGKGTGTGYYTFNLNWDLSGSVFTFRCFKADLTLACNIGSGTVNAGAGQFVFFQCVRSGSTFSMYVNGVLKGTATYAGALYNSVNDPLTIGALSDGSYSIVGHIDEFRLTKGVARPNVVPTEPFPND